MSTSMAGCCKQYPGARLGINAHICNTNPRYSQRSGEKEKYMFGKPKKKGSLLGAMLDATAKKKPSRKAKAGKAALGLGVIGAVGAALAGKRKDDQ